LGETPLVGVGKNSNLTGGKNMNFYQFIEALAGVGLAGILTAGLCTLLWGKSFWEDER